MDSAADPLRHLHEHVARLLSEVHGAAARAITAKDFDLALPLNAAEEQLNAVMTAVGKARLASAMRLHKEGHVSAGHAAELAGIPKLEFLHRLKEFGIETFRQSAEDLERELEVLRRDA